MAFVPSPNFWISFTFKDNNGKYATTGVNVPGTLPFADVVTLATAIAGQLVPLSDAYLSSTAVYYHLQNDATDPQNSSSEVERKLSLSFDAGLYPAAYRMEIPSPVFALEQPRTDAADTTYPPLATFIASMLNGPAGAGNGPRTHFGEDLTALSRAVVTHRARKTRN